MRCRHRLPTLLALTAGLLGVACPAALAASVGIDSNDQLSYVADTDEANDLTVTNPSPGVWEWQEAGAVAITPGTSCALVAGDTHHVRCPDIGLRIVGARLGNLDDIAKFTGPLQADRLEDPYFRGMFMDGDAGDDHLTGSPGDDQLLGDGFARGDDTLDGVGGDDSIVGGLGSDEQLGGPGVDRTVYYFDSGRTGPVNVTLGDNLANDGNAADDSSSDPLVTTLDLTEVEDVTGSTAGGDRLIGDDANNALRVDGIGAPVGSTIEGGGGNDYVIGGEHRDILTGGPGADSIQGWAGDDTLHGSGDTEWDQLHCGDGTDDGDADVGDLVDISCENVTGATTPPPPVDDGDDDDPAPNPDPGTGTGSTPAPDTTAPRISWLNPRDRGAVNTRMLVFRGAASNDPGDDTTVRVDFRIWDGRAWVNVPGYGPQLTGSRTGTSWTLALTTPLAPGTYYARAYLGDASGNQAGGGLGASVGFRVDLAAPDVALDQPAAGTRLRDLTPAVSGRSSDGGGDAPEVVVEYRRQVSGSDYGTPRTFRVARTKGTWKGTAPKLTKGVYAFRAHLSDDAGNTGTSLWNVVNAGPVAAPAYSGKHVIDGALEVNELLGVRGTGRWTPDEALELTYRWQRCPNTDPRPEQCDFVTDARRDTNYRTVRSDGGEHLRVQVSARNPDHDWTREWSKFSGRIRRPDIAPFLGSGGGPRIKTPQPDVSVGDKLAAEDGDWQATPAPKVTRQWRRCLAYTGWFVCEDIRGATDTTYRVSPADEWNKIELQVKGTNVTGWRIQYTGKTDVVQGDRQDRLRAAVSASYLQVIGREPSNPEMTYWLGRKLTVDQMVAEHRQNLRTDRELATDIVRRAYLKVYGHEAYTTTTDRLANQARQFQADINAALASGEDYSQVVDRLATAYIKQAYQMIFFWADGVSRRKSLVSADVRNRNVAPFLDRVRRDVYPDRSGLNRGEALWTDVALSNEPLQGAAQTSYPETGEEGAADRELCYGGIGPSCTGVAAGLSVSDVRGHTATTGTAGSKSFITLDGRQMAYVRLTTAIGSILHDATCRSHPNEWNPKAGAWCGTYPGVPADLVSEIPLWKFFAPAAAEWNKATGNTANNRKWAEYYGPYGLDEAQNSLKDKHAISWTDDLRPATAQPRVAKITHGGLIFGWADFESPWEWEGVEMRGSLRLEAPAGTYLDATDPGFCKSHDFVHAKPQWAWNARDYNVCS
jgi:hypothetical protein